jgi:glycine/D-amino acid oxidase-like deaminating enzyme
MGKDNRWIAANAQVGRKDLLVVGGGLAGSFFAAAASLAGHRVTLYDLPDPGSASRVAAGMYNVITGRYATLTWQAQLFLDLIEEFFEVPAFAHLRAHLHAMPIYRPYKTEQEAAEWATQHSAPAVAHMVRHHAHSRALPHVNDPLGGLEILPCGWVDIAPLIAGIKDVLAEEYALRWIAEPFPYAQLDPHSGHLTGVGDFDAVVFAEGVAVRDNPWFDWVKVIPLKGQLLDLQIDMAPLDMVLLRKSFLIPKGGDRYTAGSTYEHHYADLSVTPEAEALIAGHVRQALSAEVAVTGQRAGLRPTTPNRRPIVGRHPVHPRLHILNGLGTKGLLQAPWCALVLRDWLDGQLAALPEDINSDRFVKINA